MYERFIRQMKVCEIKSKNKVDQDIKYVYLALGWKGLSIISFSGIVLMDLAPLKWEARMCEKGMMIVA